ncbi:MAG: hypothetical protein JXA03_04865 [Bacteroidales bacterium]|nr:hypothetical protein [Bacteroidales bacterium]
MKSISKISDLKCEVIIANLLEEGYEEDKIIIHTQGLFKRNYSHDIDKVIVDNDSGYVHVFVNRDGFYDSLPESLFHKVNAISGKSQQEIVASVKEQKIEEANARNFFLPSENGIFYQRVLHELSIRKLFSNPHLVMRNLWNGKVRIPEEYMHKITQLAPFGYYFVGNVEKTAENLSSLIDEVVHIETSTEIKNFPIENEIENKVGDVRLGLDTICGQDFDETATIWNIEIGLHNREDIGEYLPGHEKWNVIMAFCDFFIPFQIHTKINIVVDTEKLFVINDPGNIGKLVPTSSAYLGYNTYI